MIVDNSFQNSQSLLKMFKEYQFKIPGKRQINVQNGERQASYIRNEQCCFNKRNYYPLVFKEILQYQMRKK